VSVQDTLDRTADLIEETGWIQDQFGSENLGYCLAGALRRVAPASEYYDARDEIHKRIGTEHVTIWNDAPERTKEDVIAMLRGQQ
jgi:hypothetical protein